MRINEVEERLGVAKANIRFYENQGLVNPPRATNGYREYSEEDFCSCSPFLSCANWA